MVDAYADSSVVGLTNLEKRHQPSLYLLQFLGIFLVGVLQPLEGSSRVDIIARVDAHLLAIEGCHVCHIGIEMNIRHERHIAACRTNTGIDVAHVLRLAGSLRGETDILASSLCYAKGLCHASLRIHGGGCAHALHADGMVSAQRRGAHLNNMTETTSVVEEVHFSLLYA